MEDTRFFRDRLTWLLFAGTAALLSIALKVSFLPARELWLDETHSALLARMPFDELMRFVRGDVHPPLYFLLLSA